MIYQKQMGNVVGLGAILKSVFPESCFPDVSKSFGTSVPVSGCVNVFSLPFFCCCIFIPSVTAIYYSVQKQLYALHIRL